MNMKKSDLIAAIKKIQNEYTSELEEIRARRKLVIELYRNIPSLAEKYKNCSFTEQEAKIVDEYDKLIFGDLIPLENMQKKLEKLKEEIEVAPDVIEKIITNPIIKGLMPVDKVTQRIFNPAENDKYYSNSKGIDVKTGEKKVKKGQEAKPIYTLVTINVDELKDVTFSKPLSFFDRAVANAIYSIYAAGITHFTIDMVYRAMNGERKTLKNPTRKMKGLIHESITRLMGTIVKINATQENHGKELKIGGNLIYAGYIVADINGKIVYSYHIVKEPPLLTYSLLKKQVNTYDIGVLDTPLVMTEDNVILKNYLLDRVMGAQNPNGKLPDIILYKTIYEVLGVEAENALKLADKRRDIRKKVNDILNLWIKEKSIEGFIGFTELTDKNLPPKKGEKIAKIKLIFSVQNIEAKMLS